MTRDWQPIITAPRDGTLCDLLFRDSLGTYPLNGAHFLHEDGFWYLVDPPTQIEVRPIAWRVSQGVMF